MRAGVDTAYELVGEQGQCGIAERRDDDVGTMVRLPDAVSSVAMAATLPMTTFP
jgi:hypothetical protein